MLWNLVWWPQANTMQQTEEAKKFRRKLLKRPLALRCPTQYIQPHGLADVVARYLEGHPDSREVALARFLQTEAKPSPGGSNLGRFGRTGGCQGLHPSAEGCCCDPVVVAMPGNEVANVRSTTFAEAAGLDGKQKWGLVLSSSARVTQMTYETVIGVRYPELVSPGPTGCTFGGFVPPDEDLRGGFLPVFWDVPRANLHAVVDVGAVVDWLQLQFKFFRDAKSSLAVLRNQNDMVTHFKASSWVSEAQGAVVQRCDNLCRNDCPYCDSGTNQSWLPHWWPTGELFGVTARWARYPARRSIWASHGCAYPSQVSMCYLGTPWHERTPRGRYSHWVTHVRCWSCVQGPS